MTIKCSVAASVQYPDETFPQLNNLDELIRTTLVEILTKRVFNGAMETKLEVGVVVLPCVKEVAP